jgi:hypothetical protein
LSRLDGRIIYHNDIFVKIVSDDFNSTAGPLSPVFEKVLFPGNPARRIEEYTLHLEQGTLHPAPALVSAE